MKKLITPLFPALISFTGISQNVGIGITSPLYKLDVRNGSINTDSSYRIKGLRVLYADGTSNLFLGTNAGNSNTGSFNTFAGFKSGYSNAIGTSNSFFGASAGEFNTTGNNNSFFGTNAGYLNNAGHSNTFFGQQAGLNNYDEYENSYYGASAGFGSSGNRNTAIGYEALRNNLGSENVAIGYRCLYENASGFYNIGIGSQCLKNSSTGFNNIAIGYQSLYANTNGFYNIAMGLFVLKNNTSGRDNIAIGKDGLQLNTTGNYNVTVGGGLQLNTTGTYNTALGHVAGVTQNNLTNTTTLGYAAAASASNQVKLGNSAVTSIGGQADWTNTSDERFKKNIQEDVPGLDFIKKLRPVTYTLDPQTLHDFIWQGKNPSANVNPDEKQRLESSLKEGFHQKEKIKYTGFLAQEVEAVAKKLGFDFSGVDAPKNDSDTYGLRYGTFVVPLVKAVQEQQDMIDELKKKNEKLEAELLLIKQKLGIN